MFDAVIVMAGKGERLNLGYNKCLYKLNDLPLFMHSVNKFNELKDCSNIILVVNKDDISHIRDYTNASPKIRIVEGGERRQDSVLNGLLACNENLALVHDAARPQTNTHDIMNVYTNLKNGANIVSLGHKVKDTIKHIKDDFYNLDRESLFALTTPQGVNVKKEIEALKKYSDQSFLDETSVFEYAYNEKAILIEETSSNIKITTKEDLDSLPRFALGYDIHRIEDGGELFLGGVGIKCDKHFVAHSDGDCLLHSIMNALYGSIGSCDIGEHFPDNDPAYKGISSIKLAKECLNEVAAKGFRIVNIDTTIILEKPKLSIYKDDIKKSISNIFEIDEEFVSVKANTYESISELGEGNACKCISIVSVKNEVK